ncbi:hypothetical protein DFP72DRAFT_1153473 [Ephemerocybe angulata]|uniref:Uncharacterized protein n=1 Tax=Ephemerocybe angulata TaxID=980116 RepID=A0A8H6HGF8_9AGAR|nr:hypothetical protein DFP72DRAFT_1153473 [Tulosesus angulatus]
MKLIDSRPLRPNQLAVASLSSPVLGANSVRFAANVDGHGGPMICLYEVGPLQGECKLRLLGEVELPPGPDEDVLLGMEITKDLVYMLYNGVIFAWDCHRSLITSWKAPGLRGLDKTVFSNGIGVTITDSEVYGWEMPEFRPLSPTFAAEGWEAGSSTDTPPRLFELPLPDDIAKDSNPRIANVSEEKNLLQITFDVTKNRSTHGGTTRHFTIHRFVLKAYCNAFFMLTSHPEDFKIVKRDYEPNLTYLHNSTSPGIPVVSEEYAYPSHHPRFMHSTAIEHGDPQKSAWLSIPIDIAALGDKVGCSHAHMCPISGRMLAICHEATGRPPVYERAYVFDFYAPIRD